MAKSPPPPDKNSDSSPGAGGAGRRRPLVPPEDSVWKRYSPHHELPLSVTSSSVVHALFFALLIFGVFAIFLSKSKDQPPPFEGVVELVGGGGGNPEGSGRGSGDNPLDAGPKREDAGENEPKHDTPPPPPEVTTFQKVKVDPQSFDFLVRDANTKDLIDNPTEQMKKLEGLQANARQKLNEGLAASRGKGGPGKDGGKDKGIGPGEGDKTGPGKGKVEANERVKRALRWTMIFNTANGRDYKTQLSHLGAIIAVPLPPDGSEFLVFRDLRGARSEGRKEDIAEIKRIYWVDDKPESVRSLSQALGLEIQPPQVVAFFPVELEEKLLRLELNYRHRREDQIQETRFEIVKRGGVYEPVVVAQR
jgi:hypothetical protein